jgi:hypothetical protein
MSSCATDCTLSRAAARAFGILRLARSHGAERLEAACDRALAIKARTLTSVKTIHHNRLDGRRPVQPPQAPPIPHANIRGPQFFH